MTSRTNKTPDILKEKTLFFRLGYWLVPVFVGVILHLGAGVSYSGQGSAPDQASGASNTSSENQKVDKEMTPAKPTPLGLEPMGSAPNAGPTNSQLQSEGTVDRVLHHLLGGPSASGAYTPPPSEGTTTAGGVPGGNWPGNWWIEGQGGGFNPNTSH